MDISRGGSLLRAPDRCSIKGSCPCAPSRENDHIPCGPPMGQGLFNKATSPVRDVPARCSGPPPASASATRLLLPSRPRRPRNHRSASSCQVQPWNEHHAAGFRRSTVIRVADIIPRSASDCVQHQNGPAACRSAWTTGDGPRALACTAGRRRNARRGFTTCTSRVFGHASMNSPRRRGLPRTSRRHGSIPAGILPHQPGMRARTDRVITVPQRGVLDPQCSFEPGHVHASEQQLSLSRSGPAVREPHHRRMCSRTCSGDRLEARCRR